MTHLAKFTKYQLDEFFELYNLYTEKSGCVDHLNQDWAKRYLRSCGANPTFEDMAVLVARQERWVYKDLLAELYVLLKDNENYAEIMKAFKVFDYNFDGYITYPHAKFAMTEIGEKMDEQEYETFVKCIKRNCHHNERGEFRYKDLVDLWFSDEREYVDKRREEHIQKLLKEDPKYAAFHYKRAVMNDITETMTTDECEKFKNHIKTNYPNLIHLKDPEDTLMTDPGEYKRLIKEDYLNTFMESTGYVPYIEKKIVSLTVD